MKIISKEILRDTQDTRIIKLQIITLVISQKAQPGQFVVLMVAKEGERIPLTVVDKDKETITLIFQEVGLTTKLLAKMNVSDYLYTLVGPLGHATEIRNYGKVILVGGGVGIAEIYPVAKALSAVGGSASGGKEASNHLTIILGARTKELLILEQELKELADEFYVTTDDGSYGRKGFVTDVLKELITDYGLRITDYGLIYAVGPIPMMKKTSDVTKDSGIKTVVSLNAIMVDATGMCGCCRVTVGGKTQFSCVDGPEFDAHLVDWEELEKRTKVYLTQEKHICNLYKL